MANKPKRFKLQRRLGVELPGLGKGGALERRPYPPGQHGQRRRKHSDYAVRLTEKQKLRFNYQIGEKQLKRFVRTARKQAETNWVETLVSLLEARLDNTVFRLGFASSILAARQLCSHGHVLVNGRRCDIGSAILSKGDKIQLSEKAYKMPQYEELREVPRLQLADHLGRIEEDGKDTGTLTDMPSLETIPFPFEPQLIAEHYSNTK
jgi:small subunit ribosomal protein S4